MSEKIKNSKIAKHVAVLASGAVIAQAVAVAASPVLTRLYTPEAFGAFAVFGALLAVLGIVGRLAYTPAIPFAESQSKAVHLVFLIFYILCISTFLIFLAICLYKYFLQDLFGWPRAEDYYWLLPVGLIVSGAVAIFSLWAVRMKAFVRLSWAEGGRGVIGVATQTIMGFLHLGALGLVLGRIAGELFAYIALHRSTIKELRLAGSRPNFGQLRATAKEYYQYPLYRLPAMTINMLTRQLPFLLLPILFGAGPTGLFALTNRVLQTPMTFIGQHILRVFISMATESRDAGTLPETTLLFFRVLVLVSLPTFTLFGLVAPEVFSLVFGDHWRQAGQYAQWLLPSIFFAFISAPLLGLPMLLDRQRLEAIFQVVFLLGQAAAIMAGGLLQSADASVAFLGVVGTAAYVFYLFLMMSLVGQRAMTIVAAISKEAMYALPFLAPVVLVPHLGWSWSVPYQTLVVALASMTVLLATIAFRLKRTYL